MKTLGLLLASSLLMVVACSEKKGGGETKAAATPGKAEAVTPGAPAEPAQPAAKPAADMSKLQLDKKEGWEGEYNEVLKSWTFEKYTPAKDGTNEPNRFYVDELPDDAPTAVDEYANKLQEKDWQDFGYKYSEIKEKGDAPGGFFIKGVVQDVNDAEAKPEPGFVAVIEVGGVKLRCKAGTFTSDAVRDEALELCKSAKF